MGKIFLTYNQQIEKLKNDKKIIIIHQNEEDIMRTYLKRYSYYNFINSTKRNFALGRDINGNHYYEPTMYYLWIENFELQMKVSRQILLSILELEKELNSYLSYKIAEKYTNGEIRINSKEIQIILKNLKQYGIQYDQKDVMERVWVYIPKISMGALFKIINIESYQKDYELKKILKKYNLMNIHSRVNLKYIRNEIAHNTPLLIILTVNNNNQRKEIRRIMRSLLKNEVQIMIELEQLIESSVEYLKYKKRSVQENGTNYTS